MSRSHPQKLPKSQKFANKTLKKWHLENGKLVDSCTWKPNKRTYETTNSLLCDERAFAEDGDTAKPITLLRPGSYVITPNLTNGDSAAIVATYDAVFSSSRDPLSLDKSSYRPKNMTGFTLYEGDTLYLDVYTGSFVLNSSKLGKLPEQAFTIRAAEHEIWWHRTVKSGQSITFDNQYYDGNISANSVRVHGIAIEPTTGTEKVTEYWWNKYMGWDVTENTYDLPSNFWRPLKSCNAMECNVGGGIMDFYILYEDATKIVIT